METEVRHQCMIYEGAASQHLQPVGGIIRQRLNQNYRCIYMNTAEMVRSMQSSLAFINVDVPDRIKNGSLIFSSEPVTKNGNFDIEAMIKNLDGAIDQALQEGYKGLFATGDMTWEFGPRENFGKLIEYEWQLEKLFRRRPEMTGICQYHHDTLPPGITRQGLMAHQSVYINETLSYLNQHYIEPDTPIDLAPANSDLDAGLANLFIGRPLITA